VSDSGFIFVLMVGAGVLIGIVATAHLSALRLAKRVAARRAKAAEEEPQKRALSSRAR
jgi:hypothetical protein